MKFNKIRFIFPIISSLFFAVASNAAGPAEQLPADYYGSQPAFDLTQPTQLPFSWDELRQFVQGCAVQPSAERANGRKTFGMLRSVCPELSVDGATARFSLKGRTFYATVSESRYSDGGDLDDLVIRTGRGQILAQVPTVLSYGDVVLALALGNDQFTEVQDDTLLLDL